jgi:hypothetical protein
VRLGAPERIVRAAEIVEHAFTFARMPSALAPPLEKGSPSSLKTKRPRNPLHVPQVASLLFRLVNFADPFARPVVNPPVLGDAPPTRSVLQRAAVHHRTLAHRWPSAIRERVNCGSCGQARDRAAQKRPSTLETKPLNGAVPAEGVEGAAR